MKHVSPVRANRYARLVDLDDGYYSTGGRFFHAYIKFYPNEYI